MSPGPDPGTWSGADDFLELDNSTSQHLVTGLSQQLVDAIWKQDKKLDLLIAKTTEIGRYVQTSPPRRNEAEKAQNLAQAPASESFETHKTHGICSEVAKEEEPLPLFYGPTSSFLSFGVVKKTLMISDSDRTWTILSEPITVDSCKKGLFVLQGQVIEHDTSAPNQPDPYVCPRSSVNDNAKQQQAKSVMSGIEAEEAKRLVQLYEDIVGSMYPIVDTANIFKQLDQLYTALPLIQSLPGRYGLHCTSPARVQIGQTDINIIRMVLAIALLGEGRGTSDRALQLYTSVYSDLEMILWGDDVRVKDLKLLALVAICHVFRDESRLAWKFVGNTVRLVLQLGLHRLNILANTSSDDDNMSSVINTFWTLYALDRQLSYALGLPPHLSDSVLEQPFPPPVHAQHLEQLVEHARISASACDALCTNTTSSATPKQVALLGHYKRQLEQWQRNIPDNLQFFYSDLRSPIRLRLIRATLYLRANHVRMIITRPFLDASVEQSVHVALWANAVHTASDSIQILAQLNATGGLYRLQQAQFDHFLTNSLGVLLQFSAQEYDVLTVDTTPDFVLDTVQPYNHALRKTARQSLMTGIELLRVLGESCQLSRRVWNDVFSVVSEMRLRPRLPSIEDCLMTTTTFGESHPDALLLQDPLLV